MDGIERSDHQSSAQAHNGQWPTYTKEDTFDNSTILMTMPWSLTCQ